MSIMSLVRKYDVATILSLLLFHHFSYGVAAAEETLLVVVLVQLL